MTDRERNFLALRLLEIEAELQDVADLRVNYAEHPDVVDDERLAEQDEIEFRFDVDYIERRGGTSR